MEYWVLAYYCFTPIEDPAKEVLKTKGFFEFRDLRGRIYLSHEGINGQMSGSPQAAQEYIDWLKSDHRFKDVQVKIHPWKEHCFPRVTVKVRNQLVAIDRRVDLSKRGIYLSPEEWKKMLEHRDEKTLVVDTRNQYEWSVGHFEGALLPPLQQFREFPEYVKKLKEQYDPKGTKVMMYCTGGIRCELYSALMKEEGFDSVYQLQGGIIHYGLKIGSKHWKGKLFTFDDRLAVPISDHEEAEVIGHCLHCSIASDVYFNCANMDCNELFLSCPTCADQYQGCCSSSCQHAPRLRTYVRQERPKPFRRLAWT